MHRAFLYLFGKFWRGLLFTFLLFIIAYFLNNDNFSIISFLFCVTYVSTQFFSSKIVKKILAFIFTPWWRGLILILIIFSLALILDDEYILLLSFFAALICLIYQLTQIKTSVVILNSILMLAIIFISLFGLCVKVMFPSQQRIKQSYSSIYEDKDEIENITGIELPDFEIVDYDLDESKGFNFEFTKNCNIEFETLPDQQIFHTLDSAWKIADTEKINQNEQINYQGSESKFTCWQRDSNSYTFYKEFLYSEGKDHFFKLVFVKGSKKSKLSYGTF